MIHPPITDPLSPNLQCSFLIVRRYYFRFPPQLWSVVHLSPSSPFQLLNQSESDRLKRKADVMPELDDFEQAKKAKLIALAPSDASKSSYYQENAGKRLPKDS